MKTDKMIYKIFNTVIIRVISAAVSFILIVFITKYLKMTGLGIISLITNIIFIVTLFNGFLGGSSIVYLLPKNMDKAFIKKVIALNYAGTCMITLAAAWIASYLEIIQLEYLVHVYFLTVLFSVTTCNVLILLSFEKVFQYNIGLFIQPGLNLIGFIFLHIIRGNSTVNDFLLSLYISNLAAFGYSSIKVKKQIDQITMNQNRSNYVAVLKKLVYFGLLSQMATTIQYLNYRISIFFINKYLSIESVGLYNVSIKIVEAIWMVSSSIALVQYSRIANQTDDQESVQLTLKLAKISLIITSILTFILLVFPNGLICYFLGKEFLAIKTIAFLLSFGIISMGYSTIIAHYFSGKGKFQYNIYICLVGFIVNLAGNIFFLGRYGLNSAAVTSSIAYVIMSILLVILFLKKTRTSFKGLLISKADYSEFKYNLKNIPLLKIK
jgi:O-antigen/teichoic acid export membrane protein